MPERPRRIAEPHARAIWLRIAPRSLRLGIDSLPDVVRAQNNQSASAAATSSTVSLRPGVLAPGLRSRGEAARQKPEAERIGRQLRGLLTFAAGETQSRDGALPRADVKIEPLFAPIKSPGVEAAPWARVARQAGLCERSRQSIDFWRQAQTAGDAVCRKVSVIVRWQTEPLLIDHVNGLAPERSRVGQSRRWLRQPDEPAST